MNVRVVCSTDGFQTVIPPPSTCSTKIYIQSRVEGVGSANSAAGNCLGISQGGTKIGGPTVSCCCIALGFNIFCLRSLSASNSAHMYAHVC